MRRLGMEAPLQFLFQSPTPTRALRLPGDGALMFFRRPVGVCNADPRLGAAMLILEAGREAKCWGKGMETFMLEPNKVMAVTSDAIILFEDKAIARDGVMQDDEKVARLSAMTLSLMFDAADMEHLTIFDRNSMFQGAEHNAPYFEFADSVGWCEYTPSSMRGRCITTSFLVVVVAAAVFVVGASAIVARLGVRRIVSTSKRMLQRSRCAAGRYLRFVVQQRKRRKKKKQAKMACTGDDEATATAATLDEAVASKSLLNGSSLHEEPTHLQERRSSFVGEEHEMGEEEQSSAASEDDDSVDHDSMDQERPKMYENAVLKKAADEHRIAVLPSPTPTNSSDDSSVSTFEDDERWFVGAEVITSFHYLFNFDRLRNDTFMRSKMDETGWIDIDTILGFNRMKELNAASFDIPRLLSRSKVVDVDVTRRKVRPREMWRWLVN